MSDKSMDTTVPEHTGTPGSTESMALSLDGRSPPSEGGTVTVPVKPTATMLAAGARSAGVSVEVAWKIYRSMVLHED